MPVIKKQVKPIDQQLEYESRRYLALAYHQFCLYRRFWHKQMWNHEKKVQNGISGLSSTWNCTYRFKLKKFSFAFLKFTMWYCIQHCLKYPKNMHCLYALIAMILLWQVHCGLVMATLWNRAGHYIFALWFLLSFFFFFSPNLSRRRLDVYHTSTHGVALVRI